MSFKPLPKRNLSPLRHVAIAATLSLPRSEGAEPSIEIPTVVGEYSDAPTWAKREPQQMHHNIDFRPDRSRYLADLVGALECRNGMAQQ
jgi:hypothetical protein